MKKLLTGLLTCFLILSESPLVYAFDSEGTSVITPVEFTDSEGTVHTGVVSSYVNDELYQYLYEHFAHIDSYESLTIWTASNDSEKTVSGAFNFLDSWLLDNHYRTSSDFYFDLEHLYGWDRSDISYDTYYYDALTTYFKTSQSSCGIPTNSSNNSQFTYSIPNNNGLPFTSSNSFGALLSASTSVNTGSYNFFKTTSDGYMLSIHPFYSRVTCSYPSLTYTFPVFPSVVWVKDSEGNVHFDPSKFHAVSLGDNITPVYLFMPWITVRVNNVGYPSTTTVTAYCYHRTYENYYNWLTGTGYTNDSYAGTYDWLVSDGDFDYLDGDVPSGDIDITEITERLDRIIQNQEEHTSLFQAIINKLDSIISSLADLISGDSVSSEDDTVINNQDQVVEDTNSDIDSVNDVENDAFENLNDSYNNVDFDSVNDSISDNTSGIQFLASTVQSFFEASGNFQPVFILPLIYGVIAVFFAG